MAEGAYASKAEVEVDGVVDEAHAGDGDAEEDYDESQHDTGAIAVEKTANQDHEEGGREGPGGVEARYGGAGPAEVVDDRVDKNGDGEGLAWAGAEDGEAGHAHDDPAVVEGEASQGSGRGSIHFHDLKGVMG